MANYYGIKTKEARSIRKKKKEQLVSRKESEQHELRDFSANFEENIQPVFLGSAKETYR